MYYLLIIQWKFHFVHLLHFLSKYEKIYKFTLLYLYKFKMDQKRSRSYDEY